MVFWFYCNFLISNKFYDFQKRKRDANNSIGKLHSRVSDVQNSKIILALLFFICRLRCKFYAHAEKEIITMIIM